MKKKRARKAKVSNRSQNVEVQAAEVSNSSPTREGEWHDAVPGMVDFPYVGELPSYLFRFRALNAKTWKDRLEEEVGNGQIVPAGIEDLNDPEEGFPDIRFSGSPADIKHYWSTVLGKAAPTLSTAELRAEVERRTKTVIADQAYVNRALISWFTKEFGRRGRVACFTEEPTNPLMWSHYGYYRDERRTVAHGGICIQYAVSESFRHATLRPVVYQRSRPVIDVLGVAAGSGKVLFDLFYVKGTDWSYEKEWRMFLPLDGKVTDREEIYRLIRLRVDDHDIVGVFFGLNTPQAVRSHVETIVSRRAIKPKLFQATRDRLTLALRFAEMRWLPGEQRFDGPSDAYFL